MLICLKDKTADVATKVSNSISEETITVEVHQGQSATPNAMSETVYGNKSNLWPVNTIFIAGNSITNETGKKRLSSKNCNVKVRCFDGALVEDMFYDLVGTINL